MKRTAVRAVNAVGRVIRPIIARNGEDHIAAPEVTRVLVTELWNLGDVVLTLPFLAELRTVFPNARITLLAKTHAIDLLEETGLVDEIVPFDFPWTQTANKYAVSHYDFGALRRLFRELRSRRFHISFDCRMDARGNFVTFLSGARRRVGHAYGGAEWLLTDAIPVESLGEHKADDWLRLLTPFGGARGVRLPHLRLTPAERARALSFLRDRGVSEADLVVGVHPGASRAEKRWPLDRFADVVEALARDGARVLLFVDPEGYGGELASRPGVVSAQPTIRQMMALLERCSHLVCNDSGPMHIAAALGTPVTAVFGSGVAEWFAPLGSRHSVVTRRDIACRPCYDDCIFAEPICLTGIPVENVVSRVRSALSARQ